MTVDVAGDLDPILKFRDLLVHIRKTRNLTQFDVADRMGVGQPAVSTIEVGRRPSLQTLSRYADAIGVVLTLSASVGKMVISEDLVPAA